MGINSFSSSGKKSEIVSFELSLPPCVVEVLKQKWLTKDHFSFSVHME